jgi:hypothetical protein
MKFAGLLRLPSRIFYGILVLATLGVLGVWGVATFYAARTIDHLLGENRELRAALANLTREDQIGLARVIDQTEKDGRLYTRVRFVETDRDNPTRQLLEREYTIEGDVLHFDALIVKFDGKLVRDGRERALYLWRRIYGESMPPRDGYPIEIEGLESPRYAALGERLGVSARQQFWSAIWSLSDSPERLARLGVRAIYGNAVYRRVQPGFIYVFKIAATGDLFLEPVPAI